MQQRTNFNPRSPRGERRLKIRNVIKSESISIHAPREGSDFGKCVYCEMAFYFNPRSPRGERRVVFAKYRAVAEFQSTLPARGATSPDRACHFVRDISIHAPREGSDQSPSAHPDRRAYFNPRSPRGERPGVVAFFEIVTEISIHAPREGSDQGAEPVRYGSADFNPRSPRGERRISDINSRRSRSISIHAPREGSDC